MWEKIGKENKLLFVILVSLVIVGGIIITNLISFSNVEDIIINQLKENQMIETEHAASRIESHIIQVKDELVTLSKFPIMDTLNIDECTGDMKIIHENIDGKIDSLLKVNADGTVVECSSPDFSNYVGLNIKNKDYFKEPKETNEPFITGMVRQGASQQIIISTPLFETSGYTPYPNFIGKFDGILMSIIELNNLHLLYIHHILEQDKNIFFLINVDTKETLLKSEGIDDYTEIEKFLPKTGNGMNIIANFNGYGETIMTSADLILGIETWRLIILTPLENVGTEIADVQERHLFSLGLVIILTIIVLFFIVSLYKSKEEVQSKLDKANVTLEKFGINIDFEKDKFSQADIMLNPKNVYLIKEDDENHAHELFISSLNSGFAGLGIVREDPRKLKKKYNLQKTSFIWLTNNKVEGVPCETNIDSLIKLITEFVKKSKKSVILLDRLDYIINENKFDKIIKKVHELNDLATANECIVILSLNPELVKEHEMKAIEAETIDLYGKHLRKKVELSDMEMEILKYINENNVINKLVSYKNITQNFKITKPTTRVKINKLQGLGLLNVEQKGRFKSIKVTSAGRRIIG